MNVILFESHELRPDNTVILADRRSEHIVKILALKPGDTARVGLVNGPIGSGEILTIEEEKGTARIVLRFTSKEETPARPLCDLILALPRPIMLKRIFSQAATMGVGSIYLINGNRVEKSFFQANLLKKENYRTFLLQGLEQAKDTLLPEVNIHKRFRPFIEDFLPQVTHQYSRPCPAGGRA
jgi:RsmE family RNA methyltransferase